MLGPFIFNKALRIKTKNAFACSLLPYYFTINFLPLRI